MRSGIGITSEAIGDAGQYPVYGGNGMRGYTSYSTHHGDFILIGRQGALCGNVHKVSGDFWASEHAIVCTPVAQFSLGWLAYLLKAMNLGQYSQAAAQPGISADIIGNLRVPVPPIEEQIAITGELDVQGEKIERLVAKAGEAVTTLKEYRSALITDVVTGKIDVRGVA
jgi:type I restriction enzyme S subunit